MPGISRFKQAAAEVKYNVTTDFPHLGLHAAAATGNLGLVNYALSHGQPINSVLHGVLPLHAACSGGDELVVNLLIESGADVNAPRLPLRYTSDKNRDTSAPIVGTSGSTPLHFACANGHSHIVLILLQHGAHPDRADKHGITPEVLARESGHDACADFIRNWVAQKDLDLRSRAEYAYNTLEPPPPKEERRRSFCTDGSKKRLVMKRSIDQALNLFRISSNTGTSLHLTPPSSVAAPDDPPSPSPTSGAVEYGFPIDPSFDSDEVFPPRRPSLPHIYNNIPQVRSKPGSSSRRPSSAGSGADDQTPQTLSQGKTPSKYSLRNIFRKYSGEAPAAVNTDNSHQTQHSVFSSPTPSRSPLPKDESTSRDASPQRFRSRLMSEGGIDSRPYESSAVELQHKLSVEDVRSLPGLGTYDQVLDSSPSLATRPSILRIHNRSSSSGQRSASRALRFDSSSTNSSTSYIRTSSPRGKEKSLDMKASSNSLKSIGTPASSSITTREQRPVPDSAPPLTSNFSDRGESGSFESNGHSQSRISRVNELISEGRDTFDSTSSHGLTSMSGTRDFPFSINQPPPLEESECGSVLRTECAEQRMRGNSISSTYTDNSVDNPQLSSSCTTSGSASVSIVTPAMHNSPLPLGTRVSSSAFPGPHLDSFDGVSDKSDGAVDAMTTPGKRYNVPIDIDISAISSHAQAEALVLRAQKSILEMHDEAYISSSIGSGRSPLSAKLAAYGESLELERRLKQEEEDRAAGGLSKSANDSSTTRGVRHQGGHSHKLLDRQLSLDDKAKTQRGSVRKFRRPHTAGSTSESDASDGRFTRPTEHQFSKSPLRVHVDLEPPNRKRELTSASEAVEIVEISPTPVSGTPQGSHSDLTHLACSLGSGECPSRSRTPDPPSEMYDSFQTVQGVPLSRVSTAPVEATFNDLLPRKSEREYSRQMTRTNKLAKMGFSSTDSAQSSSSGTPRQATKARFSGLKSLVHSLKSK